MHKIIISIGIYVCVSLTISNDNQIKMFHIHNKYIVYCVKKVVRVIKIDIKEEFCRRLTLLTVWCIRFFGIGGEGGGGSYKNVF